MSNFRIEAVTLTKYKCYSLYLFNLYYLVFVSVFAATSFPFFTI